MKIEPEISWAEKGSILAKTAEPFHSGLRPLYLGPSTSRAGRESSFFLTLLRGDDSLHRLNSKGFQLIRRRSLE